MAESQNDNQEKSISIDNIIDETKKGLADLNQKIGDKIDLVQNKAGDVVNSAGKAYDEVSQEVGKTIKPINDIVAKNVEKAEKELEDIGKEIGKKVDIVQDKAIEIKDSVTDGTVDIYNTTTNYWSEKANSVQRYISGYGNILGKTENDLANLKRISSEWKFREIDRKISNDYKSKENQKEKNKYPRKDVEEESLDLLDGKKAGIEGKEKFYTTFKKVSLEKIMEAHNKATSYDDFISSTDSFNLDIKEVLKDDIGSKLKGSLDDLPPEKKKNIIEKRKSIAMHSMWIIGKFLRKEKGIEFDKNKYKTIGDLLDTPKFKKFMEEEKSFLKENVTFYEFKNNQIKGLIEKLSEPNLKIDLNHPGLSYDVNFGNTVTQNTIVFKGNNFPEDKRGFYIGGYKYKLDGVKDITSIGIEGDNFVIKGNIYGKPNSEIKLSKSNFVDGISDLVLEGYRKVQSHDFKKEITIQRDIVV
ncbi:MAG: hypothetical protein WC850_01190 [Candidatus Gracilibacteria bacterium]